MRQGYWDNAAPPLIYRLIALTPKLLKRKALGCTKTSPPRISHVPNSSTPLWGVAHLTKDKPRLASIPCSYRNCPSKRMSWIEGRCTRLGASDADFASIRRKNVHAPKKQVKCHSVQLHMLNSKRKIFIVTRDYRQCSFSRICSIQKAQHFIIAPKSHG